MYIGLRATWHLVGDGQLELIESPCLISDCNLSILPGPTYLEHHFETSNEKHNVGQRYYPFPQDRTLRPLCLTVSNSSIPETDTE